ncbi:hypothetical protein LTR84_002657 [Exophiala bonariae]|uniref:Uncharacterized protein n=1 Tax=Exophiala bonariae TaxID=1690606 RepID=A0AAV9N8F1_9EURO|nr:hypothetical protein LTR84_002657 [Exophiala bonariae]
MADDSDRPPWSDISLRLQNLRSLLNSERHLPEQHRAIEALDREMDNMSADYAARERRRRDFDSHSQSHDSSLISASQLPNPSPSTESGLPRARGYRRAFRPSERLQRYQRERLGQNAINSIPGSLPIARLSPASPALPNADRGERLRSKRRKLDDGTYDEEPQTFQYGFDGQVVPGQLRMQLVSCDGGEYSDPNVAINNYPQNILLDDNSVYCTKSNKCNILLKHVGGMPFTLTTIVIKAPRAGFDAPIQEGLIFISMDDDGLIEKTSQYDVRWSPRNRRYSRYRTEGTRPSQDYLNPGATPRSIDRTLYLNDPRGREDSPDFNTSLVPGFNVSVTDISGDEDSNEFPTSPRPWHDDDYSLRSYVDRYRPVYLGPTGNERNDNESATSSDSDGETGPSVHERPENTLQHHRRQLELEMDLQNRMIDRMRAQQIRDSDEYFGRRSRLPTLEDPTDSWNQTDSDENQHSPPTRSDGRNPIQTVLATDSRSPLEQRSTQPADNEECTRGKTNRGEGAGSSSSGNNGVKPHARFFISRSKSSTAINFDPPISGRYIFVKLWAQAPKANIDMQAILAHGYGGPRFFPCSELR